MKISKSLTTVTPLSKTIALILFIFIPIVGFFYGRHYQSIIDQNSKPPVTLPIRPIISLPIPSITRQNGSVMINSLSPGQGSISTSVTITGSGFSLVQNYIQFGSAYLGPYTSLDGTSITFSIPDKAYGGCNRPFQNSQVHCMAILVQQTQLQPYLISVINKNGTSNPVSFLVTK